MVDTVDTFYVKAVLMESGWKDYQAAALCGHFMQKSPYAANERMDENTTFGLGRWKDIYDAKVRQFKPDRLTALANFAKSKGKRIDDIRMQVDFANFELTEGKMKNIGDKLKATTNLDDAILVVYEYTGSDVKDTELLDTIKKCAKILM